MSQIALKNNKKTKAPTFDKKERLILLTIALIMIMELIDTTVLNTALPQIAFDFKINPIELKVAITIYLLTLGMFIPCATWVADRFGVIRVLSIATIGFIISSIACGLAQGEYSLVISRAFQGVFGAFTMPVARLVMVRIFTNKLVSALSFIATIIIIGPLLGPVIGGAITTWIDWRVIFFINVPIGLFALWAIHQYFPRVRLPLKNKFDLLGFLMLSLSLALMLFTMDTIVEPSIATEYKILALTISLILMFTYIVYARKKTNPVVNLLLFKDPLFRFFATTNILLRLFLMGFSFLFPLYLQTKMDFSAFTSGLALFPMIIGSWLAKRSVKPLLSRLLYKRFMVILLSFILILNILLAFNFLYFNLTIFFIVGFIIGWAMSSFITLVNTGVYKNLSEEDISAGTTINSAIIQLGSSFAVAIIAAVLIASSGQFKLSWDKALPDFSYFIYMLVSSIGVLGMLIYTLKSPKCIHDLTTN
ncbi:MFS transporter [Thiotrichales bacterium 19S9-12]|nr:MFS transporter [Thiotrichales bacterium 19S9-11]MCF6812382.1 MFS transporter [Thiotrichales bacterium 19S9-12]